MLRIIVLLLCISAPCVHAFAQDTFYVKKNPVRTVASPPVAVWNPDNGDSIVSYTVEYQKPGTNIYVVLHEKGPHLLAPWEATTNGKRVLFTEIIAVDSNGRKYRQPDRYYAAGIWVPVK